MSIEALAMAGADYVECGIGLETYDDEEQEQEQQLEEMMRPGGIALPCLQPLPAAPVQKSSSLGGCSTDLGEEECWMKEKLVGWAKAVASVHAATSVGCTS
ncbi:hypothetical protein ACLOJK_013356 [Asimina triloba]